VNSHPIEGSVGRDSSNSLSFPPSPLVEDSQNIPPSPSILSSSPSSKNHHKKSKDSPENLQSLSAKRVEKREEKRRISDDFSALKNPSGRQYSLEERRLLLTQIHGAIERKGMKAPTAINHIAEISGADADTIWEIYSHWISHRTPSPPPSAPKGSANPSHPLHISKFSMEMECGIHRKIEEFNLQKGFCDTTDLREFLKSQFQLEITKSGLTRRLHALGYRWGRSRAIGGMTIAARRARTVIFVKELSLAISEEEKGGAVICFTDSFLWEAPKRNSRPPL